MRPQADWLAVLLGAVIARAATSLSSVSRKQYIDKYGEGPPEIRNWKWKQ
jgi:phosphoketolase